MPENYYCLDNFFQKMTDLESPRKNNDCYFYYYSTCTKGDNCTFRHEPSALGCETTCSFWKEGKCINVRCNFRHMELRKNRKTIPCYWESQPSGCKKQHCPFMHVNKKDEGDENENLSDEHPDLANLKSKKDEFTAPVVDPIVVNFEEESDNESSTPTQSSHKSSHQTHDHLGQIQSGGIHPDHEETTHGAVKVRGTKTVEVKTLEEIKLDRIQAESAAYYSYSDELTPKQEDSEAPNGRRGVFKRLQPLPTHHNPEKPKVNIKDVQVLTLDEIRRRKRKSLPDESATTTEVVKKPKVEPQQIISSAQNKKISLKSKQNAATNVGEIKIKTLAEIKAEKLKRKLESSETDEKLQSKRLKQVVQDEQEVSSTSKTDENQLNLIESLEKAENVTKIQQKCVVAPLQRLVELPSCESEIKPERELPQSTNKIENAAESLDESLQVGKDLDVNLANALKSEKIAQSVQNVQSTKGEESPDDSKLDDLLLDDDDDEEAGSLTLKAEDDILNDIDDLLNE